MKIDGNEIVIKNINKSKSIKKNKVKNNEYFSIYF